MLLALVIVAGTFPVDLAIGGVLDIGAAPPMTSGGMPMPKSGCCGSDDGIAPAMTFCAAACAHCFSSVDPALETGASVKAEFTGEFQRMLRGWKSGPDPSPPRTTRTA